MSLTPEHLERRKKYLTASDLPAIFGMSSFKNAADVWLEKTLPTTPDDSSEAAEFGNDCEDALCRFAARKLGKKIIRNQWRVAENGIMAATLDAISDDGEDCVEAKSSGIYNPFADLSEWGEQGTDAVPMRVLVQCYGQFISCPSLKRVNVPALLAGRSGPQWYVLNRDEVLCADLEEAALKWWNDYVVPRKSPPIPPGPSMETITRVIRTTGKEVVIPDELVKDWREKDAVAKAANDAATIARELVATELARQEAEVGICSLGKVTHKMQSRAEYHVEASSFRVLRFTKAK